MGDRRTARRRDPGRGKLGKGDDYRGEAPDGHENKVAEAIDENSDRYRHTRLLILTAL